ncbi:hypothetical protein jhhlp_002993 [Lomentospora prolificans]|uniref:Tyrosine specific protein phosphatases domain-containing protein n=1 Tax=Lomentospora prolificans TaxID=41688 RepID=A0A2N3NFT7_9PEZI|nr:hypothetical protein jhhlp_002993 [Lomentospora prolificans]
MDRMPRFRRRPKHPTIKTDAKSVNDRDMTPPPAPAPLSISATATTTPKTEKFLKVAGLKGLHLRSPHKRQRSPSPACLPTSPPPTVVTHDVERVLSRSPEDKKKREKQKEASKEIPKTAEQENKKNRTPTPTLMIDGDEITVIDDAESSRSQTAKSKPESVEPESSDEMDPTKPVIPFFLTHSEIDLANKFQEITWNERKRVAFGGCMLENIDSPRSSPSSQPDLRRIGMDRYYNVKPWSHNRVKLLVAEGALDYVNASPIVLESSSDLDLPPLRYIAMQGPTPQSIDYVWRMVAEQLGTTAVIVQLTNMVENGAQKCFPYFPQPEVELTWKLNEKDVWQDGWTADLTFKEMKTLADGDIEVTKMILRVGGEEEDRVIWHLLYTRWPDFGVPAIEHLDSFFELMRLSREYNTEDQPRIIHCSAGVGRTGTFIALEHLMRELEAGYLARYDAEAADEPDYIFRVVDLLREQRKSMVQAETQFLFIYRVMRKLWLDKYRDVTEGEYDPEPAPKRLEVSVPDTYSSG